MLRLINYSPILRSIKLKSVLFSSIRCFVINEEKEVKLPFKIRNATVEDVHQIDELRKQDNEDCVPNEIANWLKHDPNGMKVAETETGVIVGACGGFAQHKDLCFLGSYIVDKKFQSLGIGVELWKSCMDYFGDRNAALNAVEHLIEPYMKQGGFPIKETRFKCAEHITEDKIDPEVLSDKLPDDIRIETFQESLLPLIYQYDHDLVGYDRKTVLELICKESQNTKVLVAMKGATCVGFGVLRLTYSGVRRVGPLYANHPEEAEVMLRSLIEAFPHAKGLSIKIVDSNGTACEWVKKLNCKSDGELVRLYTKEKVVGIDTQKVFALLDANFTLF